MVIDHDCFSVMANTADSEGPHITRGTGEVLVGIGYRAEHLSNPTIIDYTRDLLTKCTHSGVRMTRLEVNRLFTIYFFRYSQREM